MVPMLFERLCQHPKLLKYKNYYNEFRLHQIISDNTSKENPNGKPALIKNIFTFEKKIISYYLVTVTNFNTFIL